MLRYRLTLREIPAAAAAVGTTAITHSSRAAEAFDPKLNKVWVPEFKESEQLHDKWLEEWNRVYG